jgi:Pyruvate/2-oxoacid:ferredoxin oxidoreductase delta subunit
MITMFLLDITGMTMTFALMEKGKKMDDRLISADKLKDVISDSWILDRIDEQPTVDAVRVVRCKDCKWFCFHKTAIWCEKEEGLNHPKYDSFCSYGEREEDA